MYVCVYIYIYMYITFERNGAFVGGNDVRPPPLRGIDLPQMVGEYIANWNL